MHSVQFSTIVTYNVFRFLYNSHTRCVHIFLCGEKVRWCVLWSCSWILCRIWQSAFIIISIFNVCYDQLRFFLITVVSFIRLFVTIDWQKSNVSVWHMMRLSEKHSLGMFAILAALDIGALTDAQKAMKGQKWRLLWLLYC